jgi:hypothetical protein
MGVEQKIRQHISYLGGASSEKEAKRRALADLGPDDFGGAIESAYPRSGQLSWVISVECWNVDRLVVAIAASSRLELA